MSDLMQEKIGELRRASAERHLYRLDEMAEGLESPIEELMYWALANDLAFHYSDTGSVVADFTRARAPGADERGVCSISSSFRDVSVTVTRAVEVSAPEGSFRIDFVIEMKGRDWSSFTALECDGHDFHEKTKEQARSDKARERALMRLGYRVVRFAGSEIFADALQCAHEALYMTLNASEPD